MVVVTCYSARCILQWCAVTKVRYDTSGCYVTSKAARAMSDGYILYCFPEYKLCVRIMQGDSHRLGKRSDACDIKQYFVRGVKHA